MVGPPPQLIRFSALNMVINLHNLCIRLENLDGGLVEESLILSGFTSPNRWPRSEIYTSI